VSRRVWSLVHRYVGIALAALLAFEGLTGSLLALRSPLERAFAPELHAKAPDGAARLPLAELAGRAAELWPSLAVDYVIVRGDQALARLRHGDAQTEDDGSPHGHMIALDPWTGAELKAPVDGVWDRIRRFLDVVYRLHSNLALGSAGAWTLAVVAVLWTLDTFVSAYLTFPRGRARWPARWGKSWLVKRSASSFRTVYDLHRAGGLWPWPLLLAFAWSSVMLEPTPIYDLATGALFDYRSSDAVMAAAFARPAGPRLLGWREAEARGAELIAETARERRLALGDADALAYIEPLNVYSYGVASSLDVRGADSDTGVWFDAATGARLETFLPTGGRTGDSISTWLRALHFADIRDSSLYRGLVVALGLWIAILSGTGVLVWLKKRRGERERSLRSALGVRNS